MKMATGKVIGGKVVVEGEALTEGASVTVLTAENEEPFGLSPEQEAELVHRMEDVRNGNFVEGDEFIRRHLS
jgi:hypothetical protein